MMRDFCEEIVSGDPTWVWLATGMRYGDLYHACGLAAAFRRRHGSKVPIRLVLNARSAEGVAKLYADQFSEILVKPLSGSWEDLVQTLADMNMLSFGIQNPILLQPSLSTSTRDMLGFVNENRLTWMSLYRRILQLEPDAEFTPPAVNVALKARALRLCDRHEVRPGRSVIFFPYAQSFPVPALDHFAALAERLSQQDYSVFTSVAGAEVAVAGTTPLSIPFEILPDVVERAGWAIAVRSGICDMLAPTRARKTWVFRNEREFPVWGLANMGLCRDASEIAFKVDLQSPDEFCAAVLNARPGDGYGGRVRLSDHIAVDGRNAPELSFSQVQAQPARLTSWVGEVADAIEGPAGVARIVDLPSRADPRWGRPIDQTLKAVVDHCPWVTLYACRDTGDVDTFEAIDRDALAGRNYASAQFSHSLVLVGDGDLESRLPERLRPTIPPALSVRAAVGASFDLTSLLGNARSVAFIDGLAPLGMDGLQLFGHWHAPESWGIWSSGAVCRFRLDLDESRNEGFAVRLDCFAALSAVFPRTTIDLAVNGHPLGQAELHLDGRASDITIHVPAKIALRSSIFLFDLILDEVRSPRAQGHGHDDRQLGLGITAVHVLNIGQVSWDVFEDQSGSHFAPSERLDADGPVPYLKPAAVRRRSTPRPRKPDE